MKTTTTTTTTTDVRTDRTRFYYDYALHYALKALRADATRKATADAPEQQQRAGGSDHMRRDWRPIKRQRGINRKTLEPLPLTNVEPYHSQELKGSREWTEQLDDTARDIAQTAFLRWYESRREGTPLDTRGAVRFAFKAYRISERRQTLEPRRCKVCRREPKRCESCEIRLLENKQAWARMNRPTALTSECRDTLDSVATRPADTTEIDSLPSLNGTKTRQHLQTLILWVARGSKLKDVAERLGVSTHYVQKLLAVLRTITTADDYLTTVGNVEQTTERFYGDRPGSGCDFQASAYAALSDVLDNEYGHDASDYIPATVPVSADGSCGRVLGTEELSHRLRWFLANSAQHPTVCPQYTSPKEAITEPVHTRPPEADAYPIPTETDAFTFGPEFAFAYAEVFGEEPLTHTLWK